MTYTLRNVPDDIDRAVRARAAAEHKSPEQAILDALAKELGVSMPPQKRRDLSDIAGTWEDDPEFDAALEDQRQIDREIQEAFQKQRDLSDVAGKKLITPEMKAVFEEQQRVDIEPPASSEPVKYRDLSDIAGSGGIDDEIEAFLWEQRRIDPEIWK